MAGLNSERQPRTEGQDWGCLVLCCHSNEAHPVLRRAARDCDGDEGTSLAVRLKNRRRRTLLRCTRHLVWREGREGTGDGR